MVYAVSGSRPCGQAACFICKTHGGRRSRERMSKDKPMKTLGARRRSSARANSPEWADGLRRLYDSVVEEPLPDSFAQLLDKLDGDAHG